MPGLDLLLDFSRLAAGCAPGARRLAAPPWSAQLLWAQVSPPPSTDSPPAGGEGVLEIMLSGGWVGLLILFLLLGLSLTAGYLVFEQLMTLRRSALAPPGFTANVRALLAAGQLTEARQACREQPCLIARLVQSALAEVEGGWSAVERAVEDTLAEEAAQLFRKIEYLSVIGNIAPMVGLLGTVTGMIFAFQQVAATQGAAGAADLAEGIYQALVTTVGGLVVAIPSLGAFAIFRNRIDQLVAEAAHAAQHALGPLKRRRLRPPPAPTAVGERP